MGAWSFAGSGQGDGAARRFRPGKWDKRLIWLGVLAFISMTEIGHIAAVIAMISVIGIPLYFLLAALPSIFLILLTLRLAFAAIKNVRSRPAWAGGFALATLFLLDFFVGRAYRENAMQDARAAALVADDLDAQAAIPAHGVLAIVRSEAFSQRGQPNDVCDDVCQRLLLNGFAKQVLAVTLAPQRDARSQKSPSVLPSLEPAPALQGVMYWLEERAVCPDSQVSENVREIGRAHV